MPKSYKSLPALQQGVDQCICWIKGLGIRVNDSSRLPMYSKIIEREYSGKQKHEKQQVAFAISSARDFLFVYDAYKNADVDSKFSEVLNKAINGSLFPQDETDKSSAGRNFLFELKIASLFVDAGLKVKIDEPDMEFVFQKQLFLLACKRLRSQKTLTEHLEYAVEQINRRAENDQLSAFGLVAVDTSVPINPDFVWLNGLDAVAKTQQLLKDSMDQIYGQLRDNEKLIASKIPSAILGHNQLIATVPSTGGGSSIEFIGGYIPAKPQTMSEEAKQSVDDLYAFLENQWKGLNT